MTNKVYFNDEKGRHEATGDKLKEIVQMQAEAQESQRLIEAEQTAKAEARESAMAKLKKLGLTDDEIAALVP